MSDKPRERPLYPYIDSTYVLTYYGVEDTKQEVICLLISDDEPMTCVANATGEGFKGTFKYTFDLHTRPAFLAEYTRIKDRVLYISYPDRHDEDDWVKVERSSREIFESPTDKALMWAVGITGVITIVILISWFIWSWLEIKSRFNKLQPQKAATTEKAIATVDPSQKTALSEDKTPIMVTKIIADWPATNPDKSIRVLQSEDPNADIIEATTVLPPKKDFVYFYPEGWKVQVTMQANKVDSAFNIGKEQDVWILTKSYDANKGDMVKSLRLRNKGLSPVNVTFLLTRVH